MTLSDTIHQLSSLLAQISKDLVKVIKGNKSAAQRVRTGTIRLEKVAKLFRKESILSEKGGKLKKKSSSRTASKKAKPKKRKR